jgi:hypothetical protein
VLGKDLRTGLYNSFKHRALIYYQFFIELREEIGEKKALQILETIITSLAREGGADLAKFLGAKTLEVLSKSINLWTREDAILGHRRAGVFLGHRSI